MGSEVDLREYTKQLKVEKQILLTENKILSKDLSEKKSIIIKCFKLFENYRNILINVNNICKCNAINNQLSVICVNNEKKCIYDNNYEEIDVLINDSENVIQKFETNNIEMNEKNIMKSVETQVDYEDMDYENCNQRIESKENVFEMSDNTSLNNNNISDDQTVDTNKTNKKQYFLRNFEEFEKTEINDMFAVNPDELENLDLIEKKDIDYVNEILKSKDFKICPKKYHKIDDKSDRPLIIGNFKEKSQSERDSIRKSLLQNKNLIKRREEKLNYLAVPQFHFLKGKPILSEVFIGYECPYNGCEYRSSRKVAVNNHLNGKHLKCEFCDKEFTSLGSVGKHKRTVHCNKQLKCDFKGCLYVGKHRKNLTQHQNSVHSPRVKLRPHACDWPECQSKFSKPFELKNHINTVHKNIKRFGCLWPGCDSKFSTSNQRNKHNRIHTGEKPYSCHWPGCEQRFRRDTQLRTHTLMHEGVKPYPCPWNGCKANYLRNSDLKRHIICHEKGGNLKCKCCVNKK